MIGRVPSQPHPLGIHRSLEPPGCLPQLAWKLDSSPTPFENELAVAVAALVIDSASFRNLRETEDSTGVSIGSQVESIVRERGKMHNPATGSGGIFVGTVSEIGPAHPAAGTLRIGDRIASLVSLSLTPLRLARVGEVERRGERVKAEGSAILFARTLYAAIPEDLPEDLALAVFDVAGAPALVRRRTPPGAKVVVIGMGKAGLLCLAAAREAAGPAGRVVGVDFLPEAVARGRATGFADAILTLDARDPVALLAAIETATGGRLADLVVNVANVPGTETASVLCAREEGTIVFFGMATSFSAAALGAEGVAHPGTLLIGNGYVPGHAEQALDLIRRHPPLRAAFEALLGRAAT